MAIEFLSLLASFALSAAASPSHLVLPRCEFDEAYQFSTAACSIEFRNTGSNPITIRSVTPASPEDTIESGPFVVPAHAAVYVEARVSLKNEIGRAVRLFRLVTDEPGQETRNAEVTGFVGTSLDEAKPSINFGVVNLPGVAEKTIKLSSREIADFRIGEILSSPPYIDARIGSDGKSVIAKVKSDVSWGLHEADHIKLRINTPKQREAWVAISLDAHGEIVPNANPLSLGLMRKGHTNEFMLRLTSRSGKDFNVGKVQAEHLRGSATIEPCAPKVKGCKLVRYRFSDDQAVGSIGGVLSIDLPDFQRQLPVVVWGMLVGADTQVRDLNADMMKAAEAQAEKGHGVESPTTTRAIDLRHALRSGVKIKGAPPGKGPLLKWSVVHESAIHGYAIYRSEVESGPFVRVDKETILATAGGGDGASYEWRDNEVVSGRTYWYYIGLLNKDGTKSNLTVPQKVLAK